MTLEEVKFGHIPLNQGKKKVNEPREKEGK